MDQLEWKEHEAIPMGLTWIKIVKLFTGFKLCMELKFEQSVTFKHKFFTVYSFFYKFLTQ